ncbi:uncharacterized protein LOC142538745 [Primulina tabacum]|uniref:uncharacterized protein LOC142538745 n=1 Tax=Primulina tabacum TaxID=48773 RepID=UPI003F598A58
MGQCLWGSGKCFKCGASNHMLRDCPQWRQPTHGRVFAMHADEANPDTILLTGNIFIKKVATKALLDYGATQSFISETFPNYLNVKSIGPDVSYSMKVPSTEDLSATSAVKDIDHELQGHLVYADLIVLSMPEFDVILGMDWLKKNRARKHIHKGCQTFLASIISAPDAPTTSIFDVSVVRDFPDFFADDVTGLPPERQVEFPTDLVPGTVPVYKATYRIEGASENNSGRVRGCGRGRPRTIVNDEDVTQAAGQLEHLRIDELVARCIHLDLVAPKDQKKLNCGLLTLRIFMS